MRSVDIHTHLLPPRIPRWAEQFGYTGFIQLEPIANGGQPPRRARMPRDGGTPFRDVEANCWGPAGRP